MGLLGVVVAFILIGLGLSLEEGHFVLVDGPRSGIGLPVARRSRTTVVGTAAGAFRSGWRVRQLWWLDRCLRPGGRRAPRPLQPSTLVGPRPGSAGPTSSTMPRVYGSADSEVFLPGVGVLAGGGWSFRLVVVGGVVWMGGDRTF